jgi:curved DNA-binding protein CbpA
MRIDRTLAATDLYAVLGVPETASHATLRAAYRRLARASHPDRHPDDPEGAARRMARINVAAAVLLDPALRVRYDALRPRTRARGRHAGRIDTGPLEWVRSEAAPRAPVTFAFTCRLRSWGSERAARFGDFASSLSPRSHATLIAVSVVLATSLIGWSRPTSLVGKPARLAEARFASAPSPP